MSAALQTDAELVVETLSGNRDAFGQIVARYQSLVSSLAYSATGNLGQSEDLAQETFITAWKHLGHLRERDKLRSWLCGIARNRINGFLRREGREPASEAEPLENLAESHSPEPLPVESTISNEEAAILWRSLEKIPEIYREPLVLFYREHQSVERVAQALELSADTVHQRLSRGRKLLQVEVLAFVEGALEKTAPGKNFTLGVVAALPLAAASTKAATVGAALATGGATAKSVAAAGSLGGLFAMVGGAYLTLRAQADDTKSPRERQFMLQMIGLRLLAGLLFVTVCFAAGMIDYPHGPVGFELLRPVFIYIACVTGTVLFAYSSRRQQQIQIEENTFVPAEWIAPRKETDRGMDSAGGELNKHLKAAKFMALGLAISAVMIAQAPWQKHFGQAVGWAAAWALTMLWSYWAWRNRPRFQSLRSGWVIVFPLLMGLLTLFIFNLHQYQAGDANVLPIESPEKILAFNLVVVLAYAAFLVVLVWKRRAALQSMPPN